MSITLYTLANILILLTWTYELKIKNIFYRWINCWSERLGNRLKIQQMFQWQGNLNQFLYYILRPVIFRVCLTLRMVKISGSQFLSSTIPQVYEISFLVCAFYNWQIQHTVIFCNLLRISYDAQILLFNLLETLRIKCKSLLVAF